MTSICPQKHLTSLAIREMGNKITLRFLLFPGRMTAVKKRDNHNCWRGCGERGRLLSTGISDKCSHVAVLETRTRSSINKTVNLRHPTPTMALLYLTLALLWRHPHIPVYCWPRHKSKDTEPASMSFNRL